SYSCSPYNTLHCHSPFFSLRLPPPLSSTLFPYTTLFRSGRSSRTLPRSSSAFRRRIIDSVRSGPRTGAIRLRAFAFTPSVSRGRSEEHTSELQSPYDLVCRLLLEKKKQKTI